MLRGYYEQLEAYKLLIKFGDSAMIKKVNEMIDRYEQAVINKENVVQNWNFRVAEQDEEKPRTFKKTILQYEDDEIHRVLEVLSDFSIKDTLYTQTLPKNSYAAIVYYEYPSKSLLSDSDKYEFSVHRTEDKTRPTFVTRAGRFLRGLTVTKVVEKVDMEAHSEKE